MQLKLVLFVAVSIYFRTAVSYDDKGDEDEDVYTSTDPKKREPTPCESELQKLVHCSFSHNALIIPI